MEPSRTIGVPALVAWLAVTQFWRFPLLIGGAVVVLIVLYCIRRAIRRAFRPL
ncbi:MAG: hypothetical protein HY721_22295 [Planctomycetes bacterium]|nr:hypothetical protein [Planctomycetota bacterium]